MIWDEHYQIGDGERTTDSKAEPVYRSYPECGIEIDSANMFNEIAQKFKIYFATSELKDICIKPKTVLTQGTSDYYFSKLRVKFPIND